MTQRSEQVFEGYGAQVVIDGDVLVINRRGVAAKLMGTTDAPRRIPLAVISAVMPKPPTRLMTGMLRLGLGGEQPVSEFHGPSDRNTVLFQWKDRDAFERLRDLLLVTVERNYAQGVDFSALGFDQGAPSPSDRLQERRTQLEVSKEQYRAAQHDLVEVLKTGLKPSDEMREDVLRQRREKWAAELGDDHPDIVDAATRLAVTFGGKREIRRLHTYLQDGETVRFIAQGTYRSDEGIVVLTDRRLVFLFHGLIGRAQEDFPLRAITSVQTESGLITGDMSVTVSGLRSTISHVSKGDLAPLAAAVREGMAAVQGSAPPVAPTARADSDPDPVEMLSKLAALKDAGVLSEAEFQEKKAELLRRI